MPQLLFSLIFICSSISLSSQITFDVDPIDFTLHCDDVDNNVEIEGYLNGLSASESNCPTEPLISWDYVDPGNFEDGDVIVIEITAEDDCGVVPDLIVSIEVVIIDVLSPIWDVNPNDLNLVCDQVENPDLINVWLNDLGNGEANDECSDQNELTYTNDYNFIIPECGVPRVINFFVEDAAGNCSTTSANIIIEGTAVNFSSTNSNSFESIGLKEVCLNIAGPSPTFDTTVEVEISSLSTATNGVDYSTLPLVQSFIFPANISVDMCFDVSVIDDILLEPTEDIVFKIINAMTNGQNSIGADSIHYFNILDNDDNDNDGVSNLLDNCVNTFNPDQSDIDEDGIGDLCDSSNEVNTLIESKEHIFVDRPQGGIIMTSPSGSCFLVYVNDQGVVTSIGVECP